MSVLLHWQKELERAIDFAGYSGQVEIEYKAYQIGPDTPKEDAPTVYEGMAKNLTPR